MKQYLDHDTFLLDISVFICYETVVGKTLKAASGIGEERPRRIERT